MKHLLSLIQEAIAKNQIASFVYRSKGTGELARYTVRLGVNYLNCLENSLPIVETFNPAEVKAPDLETANQAINAVKASIIKSILAHKAGGQSEDYTKKGLYQNLSKGVSVHSGDGSLEISGLVISKKTLEAGESKPVKSRPLTIAKKSIEKTLPKGRWRTFAFENAQAVKSAGIEIIRESA